MLYAHDKIEHLLTQVRGPVLFARVDLTAHADPARERPAFAKAELDLNGRVVRAHVAAGTMFEAVDLLEARMRERLERLAHHEEAKHLRLRGEREHEWKHGEEAHAAPVVLPAVAVEDRELVRHKTFAVAEMTPDEAVADLELLDHTSTSSRTARPAKTTWSRARSGRATSCSSPRQPARSPTPSRRSGPARSGPRRSMWRMRSSLLELGDLPFVFFVDPDTRRGRLLYRRYDGHYGLVSPAEDTR